MDETRIDSLRRALVAVSPRRGLMSLLGGLTMGGGLLASFWATDARAQKKVHASKKKKSAKSKPGPQGPAGPQGAAGQQGPPGPKFLTAAPTERKNDICFVNANSPFTCSMSCLDGEIVVSGGHTVPAFIFVEESKIAGNGWTITVRNSSSTPGFFTVYVYCVA